MLIVLIVLILITLQESDNHAQKPKLRLIDRQEPNESAVTVQNDLEKSNLWGQNVTNTGNSYKLDGIMIICFILLYKCHHAAVFHGSYCRPTENPG